MNLSLKSIWITALTLATLPLAHAAPVGRAKQLVDQLKMELIPVEGAWFKVTYGSAEKIPAEALAPRYMSCQTRIPFSSHRS